METNSARERPQSAVEKAGAWKPAKTESRFPPAPTLPWKSCPNCEIPTFPPRRRRLLSSPKEKQKPKTKPRRRPEGRIALSHKADRSLNNKTGQLDLLTTEVFFVPLVVCGMQINGYQTPVRERLTLSSISEALAQGEVVTPSSATTGLSEQRS